MAVVVRVVVSVISALTETKRFGNSVLECGFSGILGLLYFIAHSLPTSPMAGCFLDDCSSRILSRRPPLHKFGGLFVGFASHQSLSTLFSGFESGVARFFRSGFFLQTAGYFL